MALELSVIIPVYNEQARVGKTLRASLDYLRKSRIQAEILVVDDGSRDSTLEVVEGFRKGAAKRVLRTLSHGVNRGKGAATLANAHKRPYVLETGLYADLALVKAHTADNFGNLIYRKTARNFNPMMATAAAFVIAEVERVVETGELDGDSIHTPGSYVDRIVKAVPEKRIEQRTVSKG